MISLSAAILVATCTATFGLHSSSSTTSSYSYFAFASALRSLTASSGDLRPPIPLTETPPVNGPMKPTLTLSFACAVATSAPTKTALAKKRLRCLPISDIGSSPMDRSLTYPRSNSYESVVPHPELNEFAKQLGYRVNNPMVARLTLRVTHRDLNRRAATAVRRPAPVANDFSSEARKTWHAAISGGCAMPRRQMLSRSCGGAS